jgi:hypothetical protein
MQNKALSVMEFNALIMKSLQFPDFDDIYCKYCFTFGPDWLVTSVSNTQKFCVIIDL